MGFVCSNFHLCYLENEQRQVHYPRIHICGVHLGLLPQTSPVGCCLWVVSVFILTSFNLVRLLPLCDFYLYLNLFYSGEAFASM